jgi:hypothetical protein
MFGLKRRRLRPQPWLSRKSARRPFGLAMPSASSNQSCGICTNDPKGRKRDCAPRTFARRPAGQRH